uniref:PDZ domain-containing protein n=2 Tax=Panagrolaimus sp. JU765 TaxID=591449 RepID=A0AC34QZ96_9BILA
MATRAALNPTSLEEHIQQRINSMQNGNLRKDSHPKTPLTTIMTNDEIEIVENVKNNNHDNVNANANENDEHNQEIKPSTSQTSNLDEIKKRPDSTDSKNKSRSTSTDRPISLKNLQEMALTTFLRENWIDGQYEQVEVELHRDPNLGLGITVAGYVHKKEEINGVFVKSLVPNSSAHLSNKIRVHDLIISVNDQSLENLSHSQSVKTLVKSGNRVLLKMIRFFNDSPQAICLKMLHEQETDTQIVDVQSTLLDYKHYWQTKLGNDYEVISVIIKPDKNDMDGGLGVSLEGTVDVIDGTQLCPHHYIESLRKDGPAAKIGLLKSGDELLQVNDQVLYGESHVTVRQALSKAAANAEQKDVRLTL